jgi:hypothetical protein
MGLAAVLDDVAACRCHRKRMLIRSYSAGAAVRIDVDHSMDAS